MFVTGFSRWVDRVDDGHDEWKFGWKQEVGGGTMSYKRPAFFWSSGWSRSSSLSIFVKTLNTQVRLSHIPPCETQVLTEPGLRSFNL